MQRFPIACQTITFGPDQGDHLTDVFKAVAEAGYQGVETGLRHLERLQPGQLKDLLNEFALKLFATHLGGDLFAPTESAESRTVLDHALWYLESVGADLLVYSGLNFKDEEQFARDFDALCRAAEIAEREGLRLCYHNHNWEFEHGGRVINAVLDDAPSALAMCPDLGWVHMGGDNVVGFLERAYDRLAAVHFKDFSTTEPDWETVILGEGVAPLADGAAWLIEHAGGMPVIAEQDSATIPANEAVRRNADYLMELFRGT